MSDIKWTDLFDERERNEIQFNREYYSKFNHGTADHNLRVICAKMAALLDSHWKLENENFIGHKLTKE